jgi:hypothetical protein
MPTIILICDSAHFHPPPSLLREELCPRKKKKKKKKPCMVVAVVSSFWRVFYTRRVSRRFLGVPDCGAPNTSNILAFKKKSFWCWTVLLETAPNPADIMAVFRALLLGSIGIIKIPCGFPELSGAGRVL